MEIVLSLLLVLAVVVAGCLAWKLSVVLTSINSTVAQQAEEQFAVWKAKECDAIRRQEKDLATREADVDFNKWKDTHTDKIRADAVQRSQSVIVGKVTEHLVPYLPQFRYNPKDARFLGSPVDFLVFAGLNQQAEVEVVFVEVKTGDSNLNAREKLIREAIRAKRVRWEELRVERKDRESSNTLFTV